MLAIGLDIGGANLKAADSDGRVLSRSFAVWKRPERLGSELAKLLALFPKPDCLAVTMTAELADCFSTKSQGVDRVLSAVEQVAGTTPVIVWQTGAEFVTSVVAREIPLLVAAANWHALATWFGRLVPRNSAVLIDVGTTTTDVIPMLDGVPVPAGMTDIQRLISGELIYSGVRRTPLCAVALSVPFREGYCPLAAELFATTLDVYLILKMIPEDASDHDTANGQPATVVSAHDRLARMVCCDRQEFTLADAETMARFLADVQQQRISAALKRVLSNLAGDCREVLISGSGTFLAETVLSEHRRLHGARRIRLAEQLTPEASQAACAVAVAQLASERLS